MRRNPHPVFRKRSARSHLLLTTIHLNLHQTHPTRPLSSDPLIKTQRRHLKPSIPNRVKHPRPISAPNRNTINPHVKPFRTATRIRFARYSRQLTPSLLDSTPILAKETNRHSRAPAKPVKSKPPHFRSPTQSEREAWMVGAGFKPAQIATTLAGGVPRLAAPTEPGFRQNDTLCTSIPSSPPNQRHPAEPSSSPTQPPSLPAQPTSSPRTRGTRRADQREGQPTVRHSGETRLNVHPQGRRRTSVITRSAIVITRRTNVIPAHAGNQKGGQTGRATKRRSRKSTGTHQRFNRFSVHPRVFAVFLFMHDCYVFATTSQQCD